jgi:hypothetical protein
MFSGLSLASLALRFGTTERTVKIALIAAGIVAAILSLGITKCVYDHNIIASHEAKQGEATAKADRKADTGAAVTRRTDDARLTTESHQLERSRADVAQTDLDRRLARQRLLRCQQDARAHGRQPSACDRPGVPIRALSPQ